MIPLQKGELWNVLATPFSFPPAPADLKDLLISCSEHAFHAEFGRGMKKPRSRRGGIYVGFRSRSRDAVRGLYFQVALIDKKTPCFLQDSRPLLKSLFPPCKGPIFQYRPILVNVERKLSLRGAKRRGNLMRLLHFVRNDTLSMSSYLRRSLYCEL